MQTGPPNEPALQRIAASLPAREGLVLKNAQERWDAFREAQVAAIAELDQEGTISRVSRAMSVMELVREQALRLAGFRVL